MKKEHTLKICAECGDKRIHILIGESGIWECNCGWKGHNPVTQIVSESEYLEFAEDIVK